MRFDKKRDAFNKIILDHLGLLKEDNYCLNQHICIKCNFLRKEYHRKSEKFVLKKRID